MALSTANANEMSTKQPTEVTHAWCDASCVHLKMSFNGIAYARKYENENELPHARPINKQIHEFGSFSLDLLTKVVKLLIKFNGFDIA